MENNETYDVEIPDVVPNAVIEAQTRAEIDIQIATAKRYPRDIGKFRDKAISMVTATEEIAAACIYCKPQTGGDIMGPGVRLAEIALHSFGNARAAARIISIDRTAKEITAQGICIDLENNVAASVEVRRSIRDKYGKLYPEHMIVTTANAGCAIAYRNSVYKVIPAAYIHEIYEAARALINRESAPLEQRINDMFSKFGAMGIVPTRILAKLERANRDTITRGDIEKLIGLYNAIRENEITIDDAFPRVVDDSRDRVEQLKEQVKRGGMKNGSNNKPGPAPQPEPKDKPKKRGRPRKKKPDPEPDPRPDPEPKPEPKPAPSNLLTTKQKDALSDICEKRGLDQKTFLRVLGEFGAEHMSEVRAKDFQAIKTALEIIET